MVIVIEPTATPAQIDAIRERTLALGLRIHLSQGGGRTVIGCLEGGDELARKVLQTLPGVEEVVPMQSPYRLASRSFVADSTRIRLGQGELGGQEFFVIAGPCAVEDRKMLAKTAWAVRRSGARALRGGAFKPRTSPYSFKGLGEVGLELLADVRSETGLPIVTEVMDTRLVERVARYADVLQVGARNMQNYSLLEEVGRARVPVLLKRGLSATVKELLLAAEHIMNQGNLQVILCERGIRTFETATRNTLDVTAIPVLQRETHLPVIVDPSHAAGRA